MIVSCVPALRIYVLKVCRLWGAPHNRHNYAVKCLKKWVLAGEELTNLLPYLAAYMGHSDFRGTQYYLRLTADLYPDIVSRLEAGFGHVIPEGGPTDGGQ